MSMLDKVIATVTPAPTDEEMAAARAQLRVSGTRAEWVALVCDHHDRIDAAFAAVVGATAADGQRAAQLRLAALLTGHSLAEEAVLYPAMALTDQKAHSTAAYTQQSAAKVQLAALDDLQPLSEDHADKLQHLWTAVAHHVYEEETKWYPKLLEACDAAKHAALTLRYRQEATAYLGAELPTTGQAASPL